MRSWYRRGLVVVAGAALTAQLAGCKAESPDLEPGAQGMLHCSSSPGLVRQVRLPVPAYGKSGINGAIFRSNGILTIGERQAVAYFDATESIRIVILDEDLRIASQKRIPQPMPSAMLGDGHQGINIGFSRDGYLHVIGGAHGGSSPFYLKLSWPDLVVVDSGLSALHLDSKALTYPQFLTLDGELLLLARSDPTGDYNLSRYDKLRHEWGPGPETVLARPSGASSLYVNTPGTHSTTLALAYTTRLLPSDETDARVRNEDIRVILSHDRGYQWQAPKSPRLGPSNLQTPIEGNSPVSVRIPADSNLMNQGGGWLSADDVYWIGYLVDDAAGIPQVMISGVRLRDGTSNTSQVTKSTVDFTLTGAGSLSLPVGRPAVVEYKARLFVAYRIDDSLVVASRSARGGANWHQQVVCRGFLNNWEPVLDPNAVRDGRLDLYVQGAGQGSRDTPASGPPYVTPSLVSISINRLD